MPSGRPSPDRPVVVLPVFNRAVTVRQTLDSVLLQTLPPARLVVVDDGSTDGSADAIKHFLAVHRPSFPVELIRQENRGVSAARNAGLAACGDAELVAFLDSDDLWPPDFLERASAALSAHPGAVAATTDREFWSERGGASRKSAEGLGRDAARWLMEHDAGIASATVCRAGYVRASGGFPEHLRTGSDNVIFMRLAMSGPWVYLPGAPVRYRRHDVRPQGEARHLSATYVDRGRIWASIYRDLLAEFGDRPDFPRDLCLRTIGLLANIAYVELSQAGRQAEGAAVLDEATALRFPEPVTVSVVVTWEACGEADHGAAAFAAIATQVEDLRARRDTLHGIVRRLAFPMELVVVFDATRVDQAVVAHQVHSALAGAGSDLRLRLEPCEGLSYFAMKDRGVAEAAGRYVVCVDLDVRPADGWLEHLLGSFNNGRVRVVGGHTAPDGESMAGAALAATEPMPVPVAGATLGRAGAICMGNMAAERDALPAGSFAAGQGGSRLRSPGLVRSLTAGGQAVWRNPQARARVTPPAGAAALVARAAQHARDEGRLRAHPYPIWWAVRQATHGALAGCVRLVRYRRPLGVHWSQMSGAMALVLFHYAAYALAGTLFTLEGSSDRPDPRLPPPPMRSPRPTVRD